MHLGRAYGECKTRALLRAGKEGAPLMVSGAFALALSWMYIRIRCPIIPVPLLEVNNGFTLQQPSLEQEGLCETIHSGQDVG